MAAASGPWVRNVVECLWGSHGAAVGPLWDSRGTAKLPQGARLSTGDREGTARGRKGVGDKLPRGAHVGKKPRGNFTGEDTRQMLARSGHYP